MDNFHTGVINNNSIFWLGEIASEGINTTYLEYLKKCEIQGIEPDEDVCQPYGSIYVGCIQLDEPDEDGYLLHEDPKACYTAIIHESTTQVTKSKYARPCSYCSPCYPNQGDLNSDLEYSEVYAYSLAPEDLVEDVESLTIDDFEGETNLHGIFCILGENPCEN